MPTAWPSFLGFHEFILYIVIILLIVAFGGGPALKAIFNAILKIFGRGSSETNIIMSGVEMAEALPKKVTICDPEKCTPINLIKQQQKRNIEDISGLGEQLHNLTDLFFKKLNFIKQQNDVILRAMVKNNQLNESDIPKEYDPKRRRI